MTTGCIEIPVSVEGFRRLTLRTAFGDPFMIFVAFRIQVGSGRKGRSYHLLAYSQFFDELRPFEKTFSIFGFRLTITKHGGYDGCKDQKAG